MEPIRVGIIGAGAISGAHLPSLKSLPGIEIKCVCDKDISRARRAGEEYGAEITDDWRELVARRDIDSVHVLTPHYLHAPMAIAALEAGKHALTEKPMASTIEDAKRMIRASDAHPELKLGVIFQNRYNPATVELKRIIDSGEFGRVLGTRAEVTWHREAPYYLDSGWRGTRDMEGGGVLINQAIHTLDLMSHLCGRIERVKGRVDTILLRDAIEVEDNTFAVAMYASGARGIIHATTNYVCDAPILLEVAMERATYQILGDKLLRVEGGVPVLMGGGAKPSVAEKAYWGGGHAAQIGDFYDCVRTGAKLKIDARSAFPALNLLKAIYASSESGKWTALEEV